MRVYIAGPITDMPDQNRDAFLQEEYRQTQQGHAVMNPARLPVGFEESHYMDICLAMVRSCERIVMLPGWENSAGAIVESLLAGKLGLEVVPSELFTEKGHD
ncbi:DUF4406 domain-containing protein [Kiloniella laminariae]|uniref:DUF4406 domain-containing protein n=1 Tax=Kiloniella laminariae TaxID=454162 RepID=A0ABT4LKN8_9PROT|nr:DUF4406 domain-containing protein [Kiloniella laminariae]MCZ4281674.1 DUF4406 domain-containing protein [Kiloniella laminariae]